MQYWKSASGSIKFTDMTTAHLAKAWLGIRRQITDNNRLPAALVIEAGLDRYEGHSLSEFDYYFSVEWARRVQEMMRAAAVSKAQSSYASYASYGSDNDDDDRYQMSEDNLPKGLNWYDHGTYTEGVGYVDNQHASSPDLFTGVYEYNNNYQPDFEAEEQKNLEARFVAQYNQLLDQRASASQMLDLLKAYGKA